MTAPVLTTERLVLRKPAAEDLDGWAAFAADPETMRFLGGPVARSIAWRQLCTMAGAWDIAGFAMFSVIDRASGAWVGRIGPWRPDGWPGNEVGWGIAREYAGRGYAYEAAVAAMDYAFDTLGWDRVIHTINPDNSPSIALAERLGSRRLEQVRLPDPYAHELVIAWGQDAADWRGRA